MDFARRMWSWADGVGLDAKYSARALGRSGFFLVAVLSLALGLGATSAVYSNVDWLLRRPPSGVLQPERLVTIGQTYVDRPDFGAFGLSRDQFDGLREAQDGFIEVSAYSKLNTVISTETLSDQVVSEFVEGSYFSMLGLRPAVGRLIGPEDDVEGAPIVAVLSHQFWTSAFGADPGVLDRYIRLNGQEARVVGVLPADFEGFSLDWNGPSSIVLPLDSGPALGAGGFLRATTLQVVGRMRPGVSLELIRQRAERWFVDPPSGNLGIGPTFFVVTPTVETRLFAVNRDGAREFLGSLLAVCVLVLFGACFNVANVFLGRSLVQGRELAMRAALGAGPGRLMRQMVTEALLVGAAVGALALIFGMLVARLMSPLPLRYLEVLTSATPLTTEGAFDARTMVATLIGAFALVAAFGLGPAMRASFRAPAEVLKNDSAQWSWSGIRITPRQIVLVLQIGLSVGIGIVAGLYARSFVEVASVEPDYADPGSVLITRILPPSGLSPEEGDAFYSDLRTRLEALPQVVSFSIGWNPPYQQGYSQYWAPEDETRQTEAGATAVSPRFFETHGVPLVEGREFVESEEDLDGLVVNRALASFLWPDESPIGRTVFRGSTENPVVLRVIGVAADEHCRSVLGDPTPCGWYRFRGASTGYARIRTRGEALSAVPAVRNAVRAVDPDAAAATPTSLHSHIRRLTGAERTAAAAASALAGLALILVAVGSVSLFLAMVKGSVREIAIRMALGAGRREVAGRIMTHGLTLAGIGVAAGLALASLVSGRLAEQFYEIGAYDPLAYVVVPLLVLIVGLASVGYAARVATRTEPMRNLQAM